MDYTVDVERVCIQY